MVALAKSWQSGKGKYTAVNEIPMWWLRSVTCHMGPQCYLPYDTSEHAPPLLLDIPTAEGWKAEFDLGDLLNTDMVYQVLAGHSDD